MITRLLVAAVVHRKAVLAAALATLAASAAWLLRFKIDTEGRWTT